MAVEPLANRSSTCRARVILADDDVLLREGLASLLERHGFDVAGCAGTGTELRSLAGERDPDVVVCDMRMPPTYTTEGLDAVLELRRERPRVGVLMLSAHADPGPLVELMNEGEGVGYLLKSRVLDVEEFTAALDRIAAGRSVVDPDLVPALFAERRRTDPLDELTTREREVLELMAEGRSNAGIARRLWLSTGTVEKYVKSILCKLGVQASDEDHRRVLAVLSFLDGANRAPERSAA